MKTKFAPLLPMLLASMTALACEKPVVIGTMANKAGGEILFTSRSIYCADDPGQDVIGYSLPAGNTINGCWRINGNLLFVTWEGGKNSVFPVGSTELTPEWEEYLKCDAKPEKARKLDA